MARVQYYERYLDWRRSSPPTTRAKAGRAAVAVMAVVAVGVVVEGVLNLLDGQGAADAWTDAVTFSLELAAVMSAFAALVMYADRHHRRRVRAIDAEQQDGDNWL